MRISVLCVALGAQRPAHHVVEHRHVREQVELLEHHADVQPELADLLALAPGAMAAAEPHARHLDGALGRVLEEVHAAQQRRLPRPRPPEDDHDLASVHLHVDASDHLQVPEGLVQALDPDDHVLGRSCRSLSAARCRLSRAVIATAVGRIPCDNRVSSRRWKNVKIAVSAQ